MALRAVHSFVYRWEEGGVARTVRVRGERTDGGGSEGYPAERQVGGRWDRTYRAYARAFPVRPNEDGTVVDGQDDAELAVSSVESVVLPPFAEVLDLRCRRVGVAGGGCA